MFRINSKVSVNLVAAHDNWILEKSAKRLSDSLGYINWTEEPTGQALITYYINYALVPEKRATRIQCALFTHLEENVEPLRNKWWSAAQSVNLAVCMSKKYQELLNKEKIATELIPLGVDMDKFTLTPVKIGVIGRRYKNSGRKGEDLLEKVNDIPNIDWYFTGGEESGGARWTKENSGTFILEENMPNFYSQLDYVLIPSYYEGGPMSAIEALATGTPIISSDVGWVPELPHIHFENGDARSLRKVLSSIVNDRLKLRDAVLERTWDNYIKKHDKMFKKLAKL